MAEITVNNTIMPSITIQLNDENREDRVIEIRIIDGDGEEYWLNVEMLAHAFGRDVDDVQVSIHKPSKNVEETGSIYPPNRVSAGLGQYSSEDQGRTHNVWFEFHATPNKPAIRND